MTTLELVLVVLTAVAIMLEMLIIALASAVKTWWKVERKLYDPYGLYKPVTLTQLAETNSEAQLKQNAQDAENLQNGQGE